MLTKFIAALMYTRACGKQSKSHMQRSLRLTHVHLHPQMLPQANERARSLRQSVNVNRFSRIALNNLEREGEGADYSAAQATQAGDIKIESADAELDFEETGDEGAWLHPYFFWCSFAGCSNAMQRRAALCCILLSFGVLLCCVMVVR